MAGPVVEAVVSLRHAAAAAPQLEGVPTGVEGLDDLFFTTVWQAHRPVRRPLGGIPRYAVLQVTGVADTGKTLLVEQFVIAQARQGHGCLFLTTENPAPFVAMGLRTRAAAMGTDWQAIEERIVLIDAATHTILLQDLPTLLNTLAHAIKTYHVRALVIDSITGLYEAREMLARDVVRPIFSFLKKWRQTALLVSQKRSGHELLTAEAAGGYAVGHILDGTLVLAKQPITSVQQARLYRLPLGETVRLFRIDGCRLCGHDTSTHVLDITPEGLVRIGPSLQVLHQTSPVASTSET
ncbi:KaiC domain-containing protein [Rhodothermus profundi]|uniref:KaiC domain protein, AF_0795 family n=1 Tax=Rhodothermus profundi TaxID=633813 RepID=A0A1M6RY96_9BACT|nr:KaiC domain-containing protein [Rhodothermus profundi]SHK37269.1 KaiC domain protein, AF_0795 family [Rhodothermus profundi]